MRYSFIQDDDFNWYLIPSSTRSEFNHLLDDFDDYDEFNNVFWKYHIEAGVVDHTFENPELEIDKTISIITT